MDIRDIIKYCEEQMSTLYPEVKRITMPHVYPVSATEEYVGLKRKLILEHKKKIEEE